jgi:putative membrane protein
MDNMGAWGWSGMAVAMILFWGLLITGVVLLVRYLRPAQRTATDPGQSATAERLLAERFARSEIDEGEYRDRLDALHHASRP